MAINLDKAFGLHGAALRLQTQRAQLLAGNLANADTPNYKARDVDFQSLLEGAAGKGQLKTTHTNHIGGSGGTVAEPEVMYRNPVQPSVDGNTVDVQEEKARYMENALRYQASLRFVDGTIKSLRSAIRGE